MENEFEEFLKKKKIDPLKFKVGNPEKWEEWESLFLQVHPKSFTSQKLFLINAIRRKYHLEEVKG